ncbi:DUF6292 family protein [Kutzneria buriramensis]|uniref:DUF6292 domain-containing protein n=1 Tax=Kutzneria buriramensis TaxID=1045776 RepID=A0A3E0H1D4_9PSEU|nr:DUF6292 family protein [Kutzneria buriramensis]REH35636.1 hypothetical protein BCF44_11724 [Kutzneria buriramensis]
MVVDLAHRAKAARTVATNATDAQDCRTLLSMLGLEPEHQAHDRTPPQAHDDAAADCTPALTRGLAGYLHAVAEAVGVPVDGTSYEVSDTATAYLALIRRTSDRPGRDLMLVWSEHDGWAVSVETEPLEPPILLSFHGGEDPVPDPRIVAHFVTEVLDGRRGAGRPTSPRGRAHLAERLTSYAVAAEPMC